MKVLIEDKYTEFKRQFTPNLKKEVISFANSGGGTIFVGVDDEGNAVGVPDLDAELLKIVSSIKQAITPDVSLFTDVTVERIDGEHVIKIAVQKGANRPYYLTEKGMKPTGVYVRQGAAAVPASVEQIRALIRDTDGVSFEKNVAFEQSLSFAAFDRFLSKKNLSRDSTFDAEYGLKNRAGQFTNLAYLLSDSCQYTVNYAVFEGNDKQKVLARQEFGGSVIEAQSEAYAAISPLLTARGYPPTVFYEILVNAVLHREYAFRAPISVSVFDNRVEISSPGGIFGDLSLEDVTIMGISQSRNERMAKLFYFLGITDVYGAGLARFVAAYGDYPLNSLIRATPSAFMAVLRSTCPLKRSDCGIILDYVEKHGEITSPQAEKLLNYKQTRVYNLLKKLTDQAKLLKIGKGKNTRYIKF